MGNPRRIRPPEELAAFGLGKLADAAALAVARHLETCEACSRAVKNVPADSFVGLVRAAKHPITRPPYPAAPASRAASMPANAPQPPAGPPPELPPELAGHSRFRILRELGRGEAVFEALVRGHGPISEKGALTPRSRGTI